MAPVTLFVEVGQRFGSLVVVDADARTGVTPEKPHGWRAAVCRCDCGAETVAKLSALIHGLRKSCGPSCDYYPPKVSTRSPEGRARAAALGRGRSPEGEARRLAATTTHGFASRKGGNPLYPIWKQMLRRCGNPAAHNYARYGGRGITVYPQWHDLATFIADVEAQIGPRPSEYVVSGNRKIYRYTLDRIDNNGPYAPGNVRWATGAEQQANTGSRGECSEGDCTSPAGRSGMCRKHYKAWWARNRRQAV